MCIIFDAILCRWKAGFTYTIVQKLKCKGTIHDDQCLVTVLKCTQLNTMVTNLKKYQPGRTHLLFHYMNTMAISKFQFRKASKAKHLFKM